jgi:hypothetical protein
MRVSGKCQLHNAVLQCFLVGNSLNVKRIKTICYNISYNSIIEFKSTVSYILALFSCHSRVQFSHVIH